MQLRYPHLKFSMFQLKKKKNLENYLVLPPDLYDM